MSGTILVVGDVITDIIVMPEGPMVRGSDRRATIRSRPGGSGANQAVWLAAMGARVKFVGRVAASDLDANLAYFRSRGVEALLVADPEAPSGVLISIVDPDGERSFLTDRGANLNLTADDLPLSLLEDVALLMVSGSMTIGADGGELTAGSGAGGGGFFAGVPPPPRAAGRGSGIHTRWSGSTRVTVAGGLCSRR